MKGKNGNIGKHDYNENSTGPFSCNFFISQPIHLICPEMTEMASSIKQ